MKFNSKQYTTFLSIAEQLISLKEKENKGLSYEDIAPYIDQVSKISGLIPDDEDREKIFTEIEYKFKIKHSEGEAIFDDYDNIIDWYNNQNVEDPFFWNRYRQYLIEKSSIDINSINLMDMKTLPELLNCLGNPKEEFEGKKLRKGLIIGDVQSGKTATYIGMITKAADAGYKVVILLAGITESLRQQTQERVDEGIVGFTTKKIGRNVRSGKVGVGIDNQPMRATSFTSCVSDFVANADKIATTLESHKSLVIFVIKKNVSVLQKLFNWLKDYNLDPVKGYVDQPMLLIDDEADNASVNTKKDETDPTKTNKLIRNICNLFKNATYVGFTATPFANVFIDPDSVDSMKQADLFPEHFIYILPTPSTYIGANKIFYNNGIYHGNLRYIEDIDEPDYDSDEYKDAKMYDPEYLNEGPFYYKHLKEWHGTLPKSLHDAILCFFIANTVRDLRGDIEKPRSMLVNMSRFVKVQKYIKEYVVNEKSNFLAKIKYDFNDDNNHNKIQPLYKELEELWKKHFSNVKDISFERVANKDNLISAVDPIEVMVVNGGKSSGKLDYKLNKGLRAIAVGGLALSRGLTLEGLLVSYFYRNTSTFDVLMQMGRWFGYRPHYSDLFQIWISRLSADWYEEVAKASQELKDDIKEMFEQRLTPKDFGIKVRDYSDDLQITASNKMRNSFSWNQLTYYGNIIDTPYISRNIQQNKDNWQAVKNFTADLCNNGYGFRLADQRDGAPSDVYSETDKSRYFADVPKDDIVSFLSQIKCSLVNMNFNTEEIVKFLSDPDTIGVEKWDVVFEGGDGTQFYNIPGLEKIRCPKRAIYPNANVIQISSRRRLIGTREGKFTLTTQQITEAEKKQRIYWNENSNTKSKLSIPVKAYFEFLPERKPVLIIMLIQAEEKENNEKDIKESEKTKFKKFVDDLGNDYLVAFAIGFPGCKNPGTIKHYKANKVFYEKNMIDEPDELDDEE